MPIFEYNGFDSKGKQVKGLKEADSTKSLRMALRREGILATDISEAHSGFLQKSEGKSFFTREIRFKALTSRVSVKEIAVSTAQLGTLLSASVPLVDAIGALIEQTENENLKRVFSQVKSDVNEGGTLADAMQKHDIFGPIYINLVRAGEASGALEVVLERLAEFLEAEAELKSKVISALIYPAVMGIVSVGVLVGIMTLVVPQITEVLISQGRTLPMQTQVLIFISDTLTNYWWLLLGIIVVAILVFLKWRKSPSGKPKWDRFRIKIWVFGEITKMVAIARFTRTLSTLLSSGVPVLRSLEIARNVVSNDAIESAIDVARDAVREGEDIATPLKKSGLFPAMVTHMVAIGEKTGQLENMLGRVAVNYEQQVETRVGRLTGVLQPLMIVIMGVVAMFIVMSIMGPIMSMGRLQ